MNKLYFKKNIIVFSCSQYLYLPILSKLIQKMIILVSTNSLICLVKYTKEVRREYVEEVSDKELIEAAIEGMLQSLDPHSSFMNEDTFKDMQVQTKGEFGGLGIEVSMEDGFVKVVSPIDDTPAFEAGVQVKTFYRN